MKKEGLKIILLFIFGILCSGLYSQNLEDIHILKAEIIDGDTVFLYNLPELNVYPGYKYRNRWEFWKYQRLIRNVKAAYPYSKIASERLKELDQQLVNIESERKRKQLVKETEKQIRDEFEDRVKHLTITQGRILIKLIDRETGNTTYKVLQDIKGNFSAVFWQTIARVFGSNLKSEYDPDGDDKMIEHIILMIESGQL